MVCYYFYDHLVRNTRDGRNMIDMVEQSIKNKDYQSFMKLFNEWNHKYKVNNVFVEFLPKTAYDSISEKQIDITIENNFKLIDTSEYEYG